MPVYASICLPESTCGWESEALRISMQLFAVISSFNGSRLFGAVSVGTSA